MRREVNIITEISIGSFFGGGRAPRASGRFGSTANISAASDDVASRVSEVKQASTVVAAYDYLGVGRVVGIDYPEIKVMSLQYGSSGVFPDLDRFNRMTTCKWTKDLATDRDFYDVDLTYDRNGNISALADNVWEDRNVTYTTRRSAFPASSAPEGASAISGSRAVRSHSPPASGRSLRSRPPTRKSSGECGATGRWHVWAFHVWSSTASTV